MHLGRRTGRGAGERRVGAPLAIVGVLLGALLHAGPAAAFCNNTQCSAMSVTNACLLDIWDCIPDPEINDSFCENVQYSVQPGGTPCESDGDPCTVDQCGTKVINAKTYPSGVCVHTSNGGLVCGATCITNGGCCDAPDSCTGGKTCPALGGTCACPAGLRDCGSSCAPAGACCSDSECPGDAAQHRRGACAGGTCVMACELGYRPCGAACILEGSCCIGADCVTPPNGCYQAPGTCSAGTCSYALADGAPCNADNNACTPNDRCQGGVCLADTSNVVKCIRRECHSQPSCDPSSGDCVDTAITSGPCGGNGCAPSGTCDPSAVCSTAAMTKGCGQLDGECTVGVCDPDVGDCASANKPNDTSCTLADQCQQAPRCSGGVCVGTAKTCVSEGPCRPAACNPGSGACEISQLPAGTPCEIEGACTQNATCDPTGRCVGAPVLDGTPCAIMSCDGAGICMGGTCACVAGSIDPGPTPAPGGGDGGQVPTTPDAGCALAGPAPAAASGAWLLLLAALLGFALRRRAA